MTDEFESMTRVELKEKARALAAELAQAKAAIQEWVDQQGHNRCWYYPTLFRQLVTIFGIVATKEPNLPCKAEFLPNCDRYWEEEAAAKHSDR